MAIHSRAAQNLETRPTRKSSFGGRDRQGLAHPSVSFHLLPLPMKPGSDKPMHPKAAAAPKRTRSRSPPRNNVAAAPEGKGKGKGGKNKRGRGPNIPRGLLGNNLQTKSSESLGCQEAKPGGKCSRGLHLCAEPGCEQSRSLQNHQ